MTAVGRRESELLQLVLYGSLSGGVPARREDLPAARVEAATRSRSDELTCAPAAAVRSASPCCTAFASSASSTARCARSPRNHQRAAGVSPEQLQAAIDKLGDLDYDTRTAGVTHGSPHARRAGGAGAAPGRRRHTRRLRPVSGRSSCSPGSTIRGPTTRCASRSTSPNDRLRTVAYSFLRAQPRSGDDSPICSAALETELAEFVRPALVRALAAQGDDPRVQNVLVREVGRGEDFFRSGVIEALGDYKARYAFDALDDSRRARWPAAGRCGARAGKDWRQASA